MGIAEELTAKELQRPFWRRQHKWIRIETAELAVGSILMALILRRWRKET